MFGSCHCCADMNCHSWSIIPIVEPQVCCMWFGGPTSWCNVTRLFQCHLSRWLWLAMEWLCVLYAQDMVLHLEAVFGCAWWLFSCICCALMRPFSKSAMAASVIWFCFSWSLSAMGVICEIYRAFLSLLRITRMPWCMASHHLTHDASHLSWPVMVFMLM